MSAVIGWILGVLGIVVIGAAVDLVLPSGRINKYIKSVFAVVTLLAILLPLPGLLRGKFDISTLSPAPAELQESYLQQMREMKKSALLRGLRAAMEAEGITLGEVQLFGDFSAAVPNVKEVRINLNGIVIIGQTEHIHKYELIREKVAGYLAVAKDVIVFYEE